MEESEIFEQKLLEEGEENNKSQIVPNIEESFQNSSTNDSGFIENFRETSTTHNDWSNLSQSESLGEQTILVDKDNSNEIETKIDPTTKNQFHENFLRENNDDFTKKPAEKVDMVFEEENRFSCVLSYQCRQRFQTTLDVENHGVKFHKSLGICKKDINEILLADFLKSESKRLKTFSGILYFHIPII